MSRAPDNRVDCDQNANNQILQLETCRFTDFALEARVPVTCKNNIWLNSPSGERLEGKIIGLQELSAIVHNCTCHLLFH